MKKTLILGATPNPERYAYLATIRLAQHGHEVVPLGIRKGEIEGIPILEGKPELEGVDTVTLYVGPARQPEYYDVRFSPSRISSEVSLEQLSGGTRHALYLLLGLLYDANSTMLIEQPEDGIHPGLLAKLIDVLRVNADPAQIILASHSPVVLSNLAPADIRLVDIQDGATSVRALSLPEIERAKEYMQRDGTLAEFLELIQD